MLGEPFPLFTSDFQHPTQCLSKILGIESVFKKCRKTGAIVVASPEGEVQDIVSTEGGLLAASESVRHNLIISR
jgi:hypothetical protein